MRALVALFLSLLVVVSSEARIRGGAALAGGGGGGGTPQILYTDVISGPNTGGEGNNGIYLSIFGVNFGSVQANVAVTVGGGSVASIKYFGASNGRPDIQQISVQLGSAAVTGAVVVKVSGVSSNTNFAFTVASGTIYYVNNVTGSDSNAGTFALPFATLSHFQNSLNPGDFMVVEYDGSTQYTTSATSIWPVKVGGTSTSAAITLMGYPGAFPYFNCQVACTKAGVYAFDGTVNSYINVVGMHINAAGSEGAIDVESSPTNWRVINNELTMPSASNSTTAGCVAGSGTAMFWVGNHCHDTAGGTSDETHGVYINNGVGSFEVAYNWIENINNGSGVQIDGAVQAASSPITTGVHIHHNIIHDTLKYGIEIGDYGLQAGFMANYVVWDNLVYYTHQAGIIFNTITSSSAPLTALVYNNTFYKCSIAGGTMGVIDNDNGSNLTGMSISFSNNIVNAATSGGPYYSELSSSSGLTGITATNNLYYGGTGSTLGTNVVSGTPAYVSLPGASPVTSGGSLPNMNLSGGSVGIAAGSNVVLTGTGPYSIINLPDFIGVTNDLDLVATNGSAINVGALQ